MYSKHTYSSPRASVLSSSLFSIDIRNIGYSVLTFLKVGGLGSCIWGRRAGFVLTKP